MKEAAGKKTDSLDAKQAEKAVQEAVEHGNQVIVSH